MNTRQQLYKKNRLMGMSKCNAAIAAGYSYNTAVNVKKNIENRISMNDYLEQAGLTDKQIAKKAAELVEVPDKRTQLHALKFVALLKGLLRQEGISVNVNTDVKTEAKSNVFTDISESDLREALKSIEKLNKKTEDISGHKNRISSA